ncbi:MAG: SRPBCC domain-containing protein [Byssovorax sp.]
MGTESIKVTELIPASAERIYAAWLDSAEHSKMSGGPAQIDPQVGGRHQAWGDYIWGETKELVPGKRIVQSWRTAEFPEEAGDSQIEVLIEPEGDGARVTILHSEIPEGQGPKYLQGWDEFYFLPMKKYFGEVAKEAAKKAPAKKSAKKAAPKKAAKKAAPKKTAPKKAAPKKSAKKAAPKKAAPKKAAKKAAPKRTAKKAAPRKSAPPAG